MSGGHFDYQQFKCDEMAEEIARIIAVDSRHYSPETIAKFREAETTMRRAGQMAHRIDWLVSNDDGEESFHRRWAEEVEPTAISETAPEGETK